MRPAAMDAVVLGNGYGGFVALQIGNPATPGIATPAHSRRLRRGVL